jgi:hypothetical protein
MEVAVRTIGVAVTALSLLALAGCANLNNTEQRVLTGATAGAAAGATIGAIAGGLGIGTGAAIGAGVGAATGLIIDQTAAD